MKLDEWLFAVQNSGVAHLISKSDHLVAAALQIVHVLGFVLLLAAVLLTALRLFNRLFTAWPVPVVAADAAPLFRAGLLVTVLSGTLMYVASPLLYSYKWAFQLKLLLLLSALLAHVLFYRPALAGGASHAPAGARVAAALALLLWFGTALAGRLIGFT